MAGPANELEDALGGAVHPGDVLLDKYRIEELIGVGGMGVVVRAWHLHFEEPVAIKLLLPALWDNAEAGARFRREAKTLYKIRSEHVCRVLDIGELDGGAPFMVMELLEGQDLGSVLSGRRALPVTAAVGYLLQACRGIAEAHARGIVHRDLKPENLFITEDRDGSACVKLLDFGLSKLVSEVDASAERPRNLTSNAQAMGTPNYMSPEQWVSARDVSAAADQWALGAILFELLTGTAPFEAPQMAQICQKVLNQPPPSLRELRPDAPPGLEAVLVRSLQKDPRRRYADVGALSVALAAFAPPGAVQIARRTQAIVARPVAPDASSGAWPQLGPGVPRSGTVAGAASAEASSGGAARVGTHTAQSWLHMLDQADETPRSRWALWGAVAAMGVMATMAVVLLSAAGDETGRAEAASPAATASSPSRPGAEASAASSTTAPAAVAAAASASASSSSADAGAAKRASGKPVAGGHASPGKGRSGRHTGAAARTADPDGKHFGGRY